LCQQRDAYRQENPMYYIWHPPRPAYQK
jgi:hypothetical protein